MIRVLTEDRLMKDLFQCDKDLTPIKLSDLTYEEKLERSIDPDSSIDLEAMYPELKDILKR